MGAGRRLGRKIRAAPLDRLKRRHSHGHAAWLRSHSFGGRNPGFTGRLAALGQQEAAQRPQVVQYATAGFDMQFQLGQVVGDQEETLLASFGAFFVGGGDIGLHVPMGLGYGFGQQSHVFMRTFKGVKRRFGLIIHKRAFPTSLPPRVARQK